VADEKALGRLFSDVRAYLRVSASTAARAIAPKVLDTYEKAFIYSKMDGTVTQAKLQELSGVPQRTISDWMTVFVENGLVAPPDEYYQNYRALFTLREIGIEISALKRRSKASSPLIQGQESRGEESR